MWISLRKARFWPIISLLGGILQFHKHPILLPHVHQFLFSATTSALSFCLSDQSMRRYALVELMMKALQAFHHAIRLATSACQRISPAVSLHGQTPQGYLTKTQTKKIKNKNNNKKLVFVKTFIYSCITKVNKSVKYL